MRRLLSPVERIRIAVMRSRRKADKNAARRAKLAGAAVEHVDREFIRQRDGQLCYLCGGWVSVHEQSLDHVVPLSRGGAHAYANIKLAHKVCNSKKGDRLLGEIDWATF